jgi:O-antigen/teichoic acid export membrane protein
MLRQNLHAQPPKNIQSPKMKLLLQLLQNPKTRDVLWHAGPRFFRMASGIIGSIAVARHLGAEDFGVLSFYTAVVMTASSLVGLGALEVLTRAVAAQPESGVSALRVILRLRSLGAAMAVFVFIGGGLIFLRPDLVLILAAVPVLLIPDAVEAYFFGEKRFHQTAPLRVVAAILGLAARLGLASTQAGLLAFAVVSVLELGVIAAGLLLMSPTRHQASPRITRPDLAIYGKQGFPLALTALVLAFSMRVDQFSLAWLRPGEELGNYYVVLRFFEFIVMIFPSITAVLLPRLTLLHETDQEKFKTEMVKIYRQCYVWGIIISVILSFLSPWLVSLIFGHKYDGATSIFRIYAFCLVFALVGSIRAMHLIILKNTIAHLWTCLIMLPIYPISILVPILFGGSLGLAIAMPINFALSILLGSLALPSLKEDKDFQKEAIKQILKLKQ